jgi:hypothetical protein
VKPVEKRNQGGLIVFFGLAALTALGCQEEGIEHYRVLRQSNPREELSYSPPEFWKRLGPDPKGFYTVGFQVIEGSLEAQITITPLAGAAGGVLLNANRWRGQLHLEPVDEQRLQKDLQAIQIAGASVSYLDMKSPESAGQPRRRILGVVVPRGQKTWFFKMMGPAELVERQKPFFEAFLRSVTWDGRTGRKDE